MQDLRQRSPAADTGTPRLFYADDERHTGLDNVTFLSRTHVAFVEDAGDTLHTQRNALDSGYVLDTRTDYARGAQPLRFLAEGRDASATPDSPLLDPQTPGFQNEGDNEITGIHASDGDPTSRGLLGARSPRLFSSRDEDGGRRWRLFWTQQHGDNVTWELLRAPTR